MSEGAIIVFVIISVILGAIHSSLWHKWIHNLCSNYIDSIVTANIFFNCCFYMLVLDSNYLHLFQWLAKNINKKMEKSALPNGPGSVGTLFVYMYCYHLFS